MENENCDIEFWQILPEGQVLIPGHEDIETDLGKREQFPIFDTRPTEIGNCADLIPGYFSGQTTINAFIEEQLHLRLPD